MKNEINPKIEIPILPCKIISISKEKHFFEIEGELQLRESFKKLQVEIKFPNGPKLIETAYIKDTVFFDNTYRISIAKHLTGI